MGTDEAAAALLSRVLESPVPRVVDADALTLLAGAPEMAGALRREGTVITPHPGEAARLLGDRGAEFEGEPLATLDALRELTGSVVLLKGAPSLVSGPDRMWVDTVGSSDLAVAGMGDTLTGAVGAFLAQGVDAPHAAGLGLVTTGRAAARAALGAGLQAADVPDQIPHVLSEGPGDPRLKLAGVLLDLDPPR
jgi:NAD(P)H-hydrate epimerase